MNYEARDDYGMYKNPAAKTAGAGPDPAPAPRLMSAASLLANEVYNKRSESLGTIQDFMLDIDSGRVSYAVVSFGGFLGMGRKLFAVPWGALGLDTVNKRFVLDVEKDRLDGAPGFDKDHWPDMADPAWGERVHAYYGIRPYAEPLRS